MSHKTKIPDDVRNRIRLEIIRGSTNKEISDSYGVSVRSIQRIRREMPEQVLAGTGTGNDLINNDDSIQFDNTKLLTKKEEAFTKRLEGELALYEDIEEGWVYHTTKHSHLLRTSGCWWTAIAYPESAPIDWVDRLRMTGLRIAISPLHDKDTWNHDSPAVVNPETGEIIPKGARYKAGDRKKSHWHIIIVSDKTMSAIEANEIIRNITRGPYVQKCRSLKNAYDYFLHVNTPEKYQGYDKEEIQEYNGFHLEPNKYEKGVMLDEVLTFIREKEIDNIVDLVDHYAGQVEYLNLLNAKPFLVTSYVKGVWLRHNPDRAKHITIDNIQELRGGKSL